MGNEKVRSLETIAVHGYKGFDEKTGAVSYPIYQSATFRHPGLGQSTGYDYSRLQNPTREELENTIALMEGGKRAFAFSTGMAAITTLVKLFPQGTHMIVSDDLYGGTYRLFQEIYSPLGYEFTYADTSRFESILEALQHNTKAIFIETPSNPMMKVSDIKLICQMAKEKGITTIVDNTFLTPYFQQPMALGADLVVHSGTKYLGGHNDTLCGFIIAKDDEIIDRLQLIQKSEGAVLAPFDSWLILRGIKTLSVRLKKQEENAIEIAKWLKQHPAVEKVYYVGLEDHEGHEISKKQSSGYGAMISFTVKDKNMVKQILEKVQIILFAESLGGVESLITYPMVQTHAAIPEAIRNRLGVTDTLLRLSVGIENAGDLIADLEQALAKEEEQ